MPEDAKSNISDNVIMGDFTQIANKIESPLRVTCESCHATGNFAIFVCNDTNCTNKFCEHCKDTEHPKKCAPCTHKILEKERAKLVVKEQLRYENAEKQRFMQMEKERMHSLETEKMRMDILEHNRQLDFIEERKRILHYKRGWATLFRLRWLVWPIEFAASIGLLFFFIQPSGDTAAFGLVIIFIIPTLLILNAATKMTTGMKSDIIPKVESGYAEQRAAFAILSPIIGAFISWLTIIILGTEILDDIAVLSCIFSVLLGLLVVLANSATTKRQIF